MRERFYTYLLAACGLSLLVSCRKEVRPAPDYDNRGTRLLLESCRELHAGGGDVSKWQRLIELYPGETYPSVAYRLSQKRELLREANELLGQVELHRLIELIRESEKAGTACPELLAYSSYRDGLDQLRLFVSKMPWSDSSTLRENLRQLDLKSEILMRSPAYVSFRRSQTAELERLVASEGLARIGGIVKSLDRSLVSGHGLGASSSSFLALCNGDPSGYWSRCLRADSSQVLSELHAESQSDSLLQSFFEVICLYRWSGLGASLRNEWLRLLSLRKPTTLSGGWLSVRHGLRVDSDAVFLGMLSSASGVMPSQSIVREMLSRRLLAAAHYQAWCWRSPCPGVTELLARLKQIGQRRLSVKIHSN